MSDINRISHGKMEDVIVKVYLQPRSSKNEIAGPYRDGIKIKVTAPAVEGKANEALIRLLAKKFGISPSSIEILKGHHSREKVLRVSGPIDPRIPIQDARRAQAHRR
jgi:uncharacterized protein (TIGR00251 family)